MKTESKWIESTVFGCTNKSTLDDQLKINSKIKNGGLHYCPACKKDRETRKARAMNMQGVRCEECGKFIIINH